MFTNSSAFLQDLLAKLVPVSSGSVQDTVHPVRKPSRARSTQPAPRQTIKGKHFYRDKLAMLLSGRVDVATPTGQIIDILTATEVIEVKSFDQWETALEQIQVYGKHYPLHRRRIHLFGPTSRKKLLQIQQHCFKQGVVVTWEDQ